MSTHHPAGRLRSLLPFQVLLGLLLVSLPAPGQAVPPPDGHVLVDDMWLPVEVAHGGEAGFFPAPWPGGVVPYEFDANVTLANRTRARNAMGELEAISGIDFVPRTTEVAYVHIQDSNRNSSAVGMSANGQNLNINSWGTKYVIVHELMHAIGFVHEQSRPDRDLYVSINTQNIASTCGASQTGSCTHNFNITSGAVAIGDYDFLSIMHYGQNAFTNGNGPTIVCQPGYTQFQSQIGNFSYLTLLDAAGVANEYGAPAPPVISNVIVNAAGDAIIVNGGPFLEGSPNGNGVQGTRAIVDGISATINLSDFSRIVIPLSGPTAQPGCHTLVVENPAPGGGPSLPSVFTILPAAATSSPELIQGTAENVALGKALASLGDVDGDGVVDVAVGSPSTGGGDGLVACYSGATGVPLWDFTFLNSGGEVGYALASLELNGDGILDLIVGVPGIIGGEVYVLNGVNGSILRSLQGQNSGDRFGHAVAAAGDLDDDGVSEIVIGAPQWGSGLGRVVVIDPLSGAQLFATTGNASGDQRGHAVAGGGDLNGDGVSDWAIGEPFDDGSGTNSGRVVVFSGTNGAPLIDATGDASYDYLGLSLAMLPTFDENGAALAVGATEKGTLIVPVREGYVRVFQSWNGSIYPQATLHGEGAGDTFGAHVACAGDLDQDGFDELAVGATQAGFVVPIGSGYVRVYHGDDLRLVHEAREGSNGDQFGAAIAPYGDVDGDARHDLLVGAPGADETCTGAGRALAVHPPVAPSQRRVLITEVSWGDTDGFELTNFDDQAADLTGWRVIVQTETDFEVSAPLNVTLQPFETIVVREPGGPGYPEMPSSVTSLQVLPSLSISSAGFAVALRDAKGRIRDEVRVADVSFGGSYSAGSPGGLFRGLALRPAGTPTTASLERIWGLDSNSGADWTVEPLRSFGWENRSSGARGSDPIPVDDVRLNEIDDNPDYVELLSHATADVDLNGWTIATSPAQRVLPVYVRPFPKEHLITPSGFTVIGDTSSMPAELPVGAPYVGLLGIGGGNIPITSSEYGMALYDAYGRLVDLVRATAQGTSVVHNHPRAPSQWSDFTGGVLRPPTNQGDEAIGRENGSDTNAGSDWRPVYVRSMGSTNPSSSFAGLAGHGQPLDVRLNAGSGGGLTLVINAGPAHAGYTWIFFFSFGHQGGAGPFFGLGPDALANYLAVPISGALDANGSARLDLPAGTFPSGLATDTIFALQSPAGLIELATLILEYDS